MTARHIFMTTSLLLAFSAAPAFAQTATSTATTTKPDIFSRMFSGNKSASSSASTGNAATVNKSQTQRHVHTYLARNYDHRPGHTYAHGKGKNGTTTTTTTPISSSSGFFSRFKKTNTSQ